MSGEGGLADNEDREGGAASVSGKVWSDELALWSPLDIHF
jgi:hypothetical protein